jgi:hypothetical protein
LPRKKYKRREWWRKPLKGWRLGREKEGRREGSSDGKRY